MNQQMFLKAAVLISFLGLAPVSAQTSDRPDGMRFVPDVAAQFRAQTERGDALGFHIGGSPDPSGCRHYQGMTRVDGADGTPFFLITRSGVTPDIPCPLPSDEDCCDDSPGETRHGHLIVFRMDSREKNGERMRSNRLLSGIHVDDTLPPPEDRATIYFTVVGGDPSDPDPAKHPGLVFQDGEGFVPRVYEHPGGMQLVGKMLAIAVEEPRPYPRFCEVFGLSGSCFAPIPFEPGSDICDVFPGRCAECEICFTYERAPHPTAIMFFDVTDPEGPIFKSQFTPYLENGTPFNKAGVVAVTPLPNGLYLMAVTGGSHPDNLHYFRSLPLGDCEVVDCTLANPALSWERVGATPYPDLQDDHQTLQFLREGNIDGQLYLIGARGHVEIGALFEDRDRRDLYTVDCPSKNYEPGEEITFDVRFNGDRITPRSSTGSNELLTSLAAASDFYISPSGELILYATEHDNDGPSGTVNAGEWRHINMARDGSPNFLPNVAVDGPYEVDEGGSVSLTGSAGPPITKAWIELFHADNFGGDHFSTFYPVVDYDDYGLDDFDDFSTLEFQFLIPEPFTHNDKARSLKWFAPEGCEIAILKFTGSGFQARFLPDGGFHEVADLSQTFPDMDEEIDAVDFLEGCDAYYATPVDLQWDLDVNGSFETTGSPVTFDAIAFDGPVTVEVPAQAQHPFGGPPGQTSATVTVRNVAPELAAFHVTDSAGNEVNVDVPFVLTNLPVTVSADFSDPGVLDHQIATLDWGDGTVDPNTVFTTFDEAFGDATGAMSHAHPYSVSGSYTVVLSVVDDDGGADAESAVVRALTPEEAVGEIIDLLDDLIAGTSNSQIRKQLLKARVALAGSEQGNSNNGALAKIRQGNNNAARAFLRQAIDRLREAQAAGADVASLIALLEQVSAALPARQSRPSSEEKVERTDTSPDQGVR